MPLILNDSTDADKERQRQENLKANAPLQRGMATAQSQEKTNRRNELDQNLKDLARVALNRDKNQNGRDCYDRKWRSVRDIAQRFASAFGESVRVPAHIPPPALTEADSIEIKPGAHDLGKYTETKGMGASGAGLPSQCVEGSLAWLEMQPK